MICERCFRPLSDGEHGLYACPYQPRPVSYVVRPDSIPGGLVIAHGLCHEDGTPRRYDSRSDINLECAKRGLMPWSEAYTEDRTKDARVHADWLRSGEAQRQKAERDEMRRAGVRPTATPPPMPASDPARREQIRRIARERLQALR